jgi:hypothetical protein
MQRIWKQGRSLGGGGVMVRPPHVAESKGQRNEYLRENNLIFCAQQVLNYRDKREFNNCDFFKSL